MARSEAQKAADKRYRETHTSNQGTWAAHISPEEKRAFDALLKENDLGKTEFLRIAIEKLKKAAENGENWK
jgi:hypothetical protein